MDTELKAVVEALLFASDEPLPLRRLCALAGDRPAAEVRAALEGLRADFVGTGSALQVAEIGGGYRLLTRPELAPWVARLLVGPGRARLSQPALETLAIVAYEQPVTRVRLEEIRGVNVEGVLRTLVERELITVVGRDEGLGRPLLYGTTGAFLAYFGLNDTADLPRMDELEIFLAARDAEAGSAGPAGDARGPESAAGSLPTAEPAGDEDPAGKALAEVEWEAGDAGARGTGA